MNCAKTGQLIFQLRQEKGLTQQQLAEKLGVSNKTVSKWERGLGLPDPVFWNPLSALLEADISRLLQGELRPNRLDPGRVDKTLFYTCPCCGNVLLSTGPASLSCCGRPLAPMAIRQGAPDFPVSVQESDGELYIQADHPMEKTHFLSFAAYVDPRRVLLVRLYPEEQAAFRLPLPSSRGSLYLCCSRHGLQKLPFPG